MRPHTWHLISFKLANISHNAACCFSHAATRNHNPPPRPVRLATDIAARPSTLLPGRYHAESGLLPTPAEPRCWPSAPPPGHAAQPPPLPPNATSVGLPTVGPTTRPHRRSTAYPQWLSCDVGCRHRHPALPPGCHHYPLPPLPFSHPLLAAHRPPCQCPCSHPSSAQSRHCHRPPLSSQQCC
jgi:hypothetical protein